jgi:hypothetical protein
VGGTQIYSVQELIEIIRNCVSTGWAAEIELFQTVQDMLDWWRRLLRPGSGPVTWQSGGEARCA